MVPLCISRFTAQTHLIFWYKYEIHALNMGLREIHNPMSINGLWKWKQITCTQPQPQALHSITCVPLSFSLGVINMSHSHWQSISVLFQTWPELLQPPTSSRWTVSSDHAASGMSSTKSVIGFLSSLPFEVGSSSWVETEMYVSSLTPVSGPTFSTLSWSSHALSSLSSLLSSLKDLLASLNSIPSSSSGSKSRFLHGYMLEGAHIKKDRRLTWIQGQYYEQLKSQEVKLSFS